ncbi:MAG TPA: glycerophosphodiester phosphodiesterase [Longimicrobiales bacterium]|nr:glycerophosphodiester phosphodiesterase [Longimicrobiales bacterium]
MSRSVPAPHPVLSGGPLLIAHRGGAALAPENTLLAFRQAVERWRADMIELDVRASADRQCVVIHDATVDRTTNGTGAVAELTTKQLQSLDAGFRFTSDGGHSFPQRGQGVRIPTIDEVFAALPDVRITVEVKAAAAQRPLFDAIARANAGARVVAAGEHDVFRTEFGGWPGCVSASREQAMPFWVLHRAGLGRFGRLRAHVVQTCEVMGKRRLVTPKLIRALHAHGILVHVWTVNEVPDMERLLDWGVDGILTDRPDRLARVLHDRLGRPLPPGLI